MARSGAVGIGVIGAGMISDQYLSFLARCADVRLVAIGDVNAERAAAQADRYNIPVSGAPERVLDNNQVEIVLNLTIPEVHVEVSTNALQAGKHVWSEKPIGIDRASSKRLVDLAQEKDLLLGVAPDTVLGPTWQTAKRAIQDGVIGTPLTAVTAFQGPGPEVFHPNPGFLYARGAGPLFDIGPYYLTALVQLLGPIAEVLAAGHRSQDHREVLVGPNAGEPFPVDVLTHIAVVSNFTGGQTASSLMSADIPRHKHGVFEVHGTEGTLVLGNPNYHGEIPILRYGKSAEVEGIELIQQSTTIPEVGPLTTRGVGALTMARTVRNGGELHVATGELGYHVLDVMVSIEESVATRGYVSVESTLDPIPALPADFDPFEATLVP
ncbi:oxidoreductase [Microbacterium sp. Leaf288]|uniref:Gfo/Idh/MocA family protein n=1 Tax=Microbacterium sp. Leaf288 TaxID=1736323 RepID=UPI0006FB02FD|nr:Gfo/Idh/MocA family oxidoreductase [Microbacterium sp. Leaf288]KQP67850.1 oxidoreductase [Microbacterium sp. Leaf288]